MKLIFIVFLFLSYTFSYTCNQNWDLKKAPISDEDLGRYIWYWWKEFNLNIWSFGCFSLFKDASLLCDFEKYNKIKQISDLKLFLEKYYAKLSTWDIKTRIWNLINKIKNYSWDVNSFVTINFSDFFYIENYYKSKTIKISNEWIFIPYNFLIPLNVVFNWTLQNLSSYYTDIWYIWLFLWILFIFSFFIWIYKKDIILINISLVSIFWYLFWWFLWSGIVWYGIWIIIWTIINVLVFINHFKTNKYYKVFITLFILFLVWQLILNFVRMASQSVWWPYSWYRQSVWKNIDYENWKEIKIIPYTSDYLFNLQFPIYKKTIQAFDNRSWSVFLAWTYMRYFLKNQKDIYYDQMLVSLWELFSDWDVCKAYKRLKDKKVEYIWIDLNIWTVTNFSNWWNKTLFDRFFWNINLLNFNLDEYWVLTFLWWLKEENFIDYFYSNNIWAIYWFKLESENIKSYIWKDLSNKDLAIIRWILVASKYPWVYEMWKRIYGFDVYQILYKIMLDRINTLDFVYDFADVYWFNLEDQEIEKIKSILSKFLIWEKPSIEEFRNLSYEWKRFMNEIWNFYIYITKENQENINKFLSNFLTNAILWQSDILVVKLK